MERESRGEPIRKKAVPCRTKSLNILARSAAVLTIATTAGAIAAEETGLYNTPAPVGSASHLILDNIPESFLNLANFLPKARDVQAQPLNLDSGDSNQNQDNQTGRREPRTINDAFSDIAVREPTFGGMFYDEQGRLNVYLINTNRKESAKSAISVVFGSERIPQGEIHVLRAEHSFNQLRTWQESALSLFSVPGVLKTEIDHKTNKLEIGIQNTQNTAQLNEALSNLGIPREAVTITQSEQVKTQQSLRDYVRPTAGGLEIQHPYYICTLGFNAVLNEQEGFVTASHCSTTQSSVEGSLFYQDDAFISGDLIGHETVDPAFTTCPTNPSACRYSDAAFVEYQNGANFTLGKIKKTQGLNDPNSLLSKNIIGEFAIATTADAIVGDTVYKEGESTGLTQGTVTGTCVDENMVTYIMRCNMEANFMSAAGDSGSPVFKITNPASGEITLVAVHWGGKGSTGITTDEGRPVTSTGVASPISSVMNELGQMNVLPNSENPTPTATNTQIATPTQTPIPTTPAAVGGFSELTNVQVQQHEVSSEKFSTDNTALDALTGAFLSILLATTVAIRVRKHKLSKK